MLARRPSLRPASLLLLALIAGCGAGEDVTTRSLANAERIWHEAKIRNYNLEWVSSGARDGHYTVYVRDGIVKAVYAYVDDRKLGKPRQIEVKPGDSSYYGVDGLFKILAEERAQLDEPMPFGQPKGTRALLRFVADPKLGYPTRYRRDVVGSPKGLALDVIRLVPNPDAAIPPPSS